MGFRFTHSAADHFVGGLGIVVNGMVCRSGKREVKGCADFCRPSGVMGVKTSHEHGVLICTQETK